jgi:1,2-diacylglycerol 3-beta-galactosyltransferase
MDLDLPAVFLMGGGEGMRPIKKTEKPVGQIVIICDQNKNLVASMEAIEWKIPLKVITNE